MQKQYKALAVKNTVVHMVIFVQKTLKFAGKNQFLLSPVSRFIKTFILQPYFTTASGILKFFNNPKLMLKLSILSLRILKHQKQILYIV